MRRFLLAGLIMSLPTTARSSAPSAATAAAVDVGHAQDLLDARAWVARVLAGPAGAVVDADAARGRAAVEGAGLWANPGLRLERQSGPLLNQSQGSQDFLALEMALPVSGHPGLSRQAAQQRAGATDLDAIQARQRLAHQALQVFIDVVAGGRRTRTLGEERAALLPVVQAAVRRAEAGESSRAQALRLTLELARVDDDAAAAAADVDAARARAEALAGGPLPAFSDVLPAPADTRPDGDAVVVQALHTRSEAAATDEDAANRRIIPDLLVGGGPSLLQTGSADMAVGYLVTVGIELPVFDHGQGDAARARGDRLALDAERVVVSQRLGTERAAAAHRARQASHRSEAFATAVVQARSLFDAAAADFGVGSGDVVAFVDAAAAVREARLHLITVQADAARAAVDLAFLNGTLVGSPEPAR